MDFIELYQQEPQKYWQPPKGNTLIKDIFDNPMRYAKDYVATQKYDGEWAMVLVNENHEVYIHSRSRGVSGEFGNFTEKVPHLVELFKQLPKNTCLLGELCFEDETKTSKDVGSILRCLPPKAIARQKDNPLIFRAFDCLYYHNLDLTTMPYSERMGYVARVIAAFSFDYTDYIRMVKFIPITENFAETVTELWGRGAEGVVLVKQNSLYAFGKRPARESIKIKKTTGELELKVVDTVEPNKLYEGKDFNGWKYWDIDNETPVTKPYFYGWKNGIVVDNNGTEVSVASGLTDNDREWLATEEAQNYIKGGKLYAVVSAMEIDAASGSLRHPYLVRLRTDVE